MFQSLTHTPFFRGVAATVIVAFVSLIPVQSGYAQVVMPMPAPGQMVRTTGHFEPALMAGLRVDMKDPFKFYFIMDKGEKFMAGDVESQEYQKIIKYFLASLTIANDDMWVNLSPHEANRIIPDNFAQTSMGRDLLAQDYILKQFTASLIYPEDKVGRDFWDKVYAKVYERYGTTEIPLDTFNKVWITADKADIYQKNDTAFLVSSHLKVMLEQDFMAVEQNKEQFGNVQASDIPEANAARKIAADIVREIIVPVIEKEVNDGENFAQVRQVYSAMIMATWFKKTLKESLLGQIYADKNKVAGVRVDDPQAKEKIYQKYVEAYKAGVFNYIKEEVDPMTHEMLPRKYFSGGLKAIDPSMVTKVNYDQAMKDLKQGNRSLRDIARKALVTAFFISVSAMGSMGFTVNATAQTQPAVAPVVQIADTTSAVSKLKEGLVKLGVRVKELTERKANVNRGIQDTLQQDIDALNSKIRDMEALLEGLAPGSVSPEKLQQDKDSLENDIRALTLKVNELRNGSEGMASSAKETYDARILELTKKLGNLEKLFDMLGTPSAETNVVEAGQVSDEFQVGNLSKELSEAIKGSLKPVHLVDVQAIQEGSVEDVNAKLEEVKQEIRKNDDLRNKVDEVRHNNAVTEAKTRVVVKFKEDTQKVEKLQKEKAALLETQKNLLKQIADNKAEAQRQQKEEQARVSNERKGSMFMLAIGGVVGILTAIGLIRGVALKDKKSLAGKRKTGEEGNPPPADEVVDNGNKLADVDKKLEEGVKELEVIQAGVASKVNPEIAALQEKITAIEKEVAAAVAKIKQLNEEIAALGQMSGPERELLDQVKRIEGLMKSKEGDLQDKLNAVKSGIEQLKAVLEVQRTAAKVRELNASTIKKFDLPKARAALARIDQEMANLTAIEDLLGKDPLGNFLAAQELLKEVYLAVNNAPAMRKLLAKLKIAQGERKQARRALQDASDQLRGLKKMAATPGAVQQKQEKLSPEELLARTVFFGPDNINGENDGNLMDQLKQEFSGLPMAKKVEIVKAIVKRLNEAQDIVDQERNDRLGIINDWLAKNEPVATGDDMRLVGGMYFGVGEVYGPDSTIKSEDLRSKFNTWSHEKQVAVLTELVNKINGNDIFDAKEKADRVALLQKWLDDNPLQPAVEAPAKATAAPTAPATEKPAVVEQDQRAPVEVSPNDMKVGGEAVLGVDESLKEHISAEAHERSLNKFNAWLPEKQVAVLKAMVNALKSQTDLTPDQEADRGRFVESLNNRLEELRQNAVEFVIMDGWNSETNAFDKTTPASDRYLAYKPVFQAETQEDKVTLVNKAIAEYENEKDLTGDEEKDRVLRMEQLKAWVAANGVEAPAAVKQDQAPVEVSETEINDAQHAIMFGWNEKDGYLAFPVDNPLNQNIADFRALPVEKQRAAVQEGKIRINKREFQANEADKKKYSDNFDAWFKANQDLGGINLSDKHLTMNIKVDGQGMPLPAQLQDAAMRNIQGLSPVIRAIAPVTAENMPVLTELLQMSAAPAP